MTHCNWKESFTCVLYVGLLLVSFSSAAPCMDEDSAGGGDLAEQKLILKKKKRKNRMQLCISLLVRTCGCG